VNIIQLCSLISFVERGQIGIVRVGINARRVQFIEEQIIKGNIKELRFVG